MNKFEGVANTLFVPLVARIHISKQFPEYFYDEKALELETDFLTSKGIPVDDSSIHYLLNEITKLIRNINRLNAHDEVIRKQNI